MTEKSNILELKAAAVVEYNRIIDELGVSQDDALAFDHIFSPFQSFSAQWKLQLDCGNNSLIFEQLYDFYKAFGDAKIAKLFLDQAGSLGKDRLSVESAHEDIISLWEHQQRYVRLARDRRHCENKNSDDIDGIDKEIQLSDDAQVLFKHGLDFYECQSKGLTEHAAIHARSSFEKASELGHCHAPYFLGLIYLYGLDCIEVDKAQGINFLRLAKSRGDIQAIFHLATLALREGKEDDALELLADVSKRKLEYCNSDDENYPIAISKLFCARHSFENNSFDDYLSQAKTVCWEVLQFSIRKYRLQNLTRLSMLDPDWNTIAIFANSCIRDIDYISNIKKKEQEKSQAKIEERNKVIADLSHSIKNLISTVINPLENMKMDAAVKQPIIDNAIRGANLVRQIVNAMSLSYKGSIEDFRHDAKNNDGNDRQNIKMMILESLKNAVGNMYDGKYFSDFQAGYFQTKESFIDSKLKWNVNVSQSKNLEEVSDFTRAYFFEIFTSIKHTENLIIGNERGSAIKLLILFSELIQNAVKHSSFVERDKRFIKIEILDSSKEISFLIENRFNPKKRVKTAGLGNVVITNFAKLLNTIPVISTENDIYSVKITFENFWGRSYS